MKNTILKQLVCPILCILLMQSCRSTKSVSSSSSSTSAVHTETTDSSYHHQTATTRKVTSITVIPQSGSVRTAADTIPSESPELPMPSPVSTPIEQLVTRLMEQGGGTIIIREEEQLQQVQTTTINQTSLKDTTTTQKNQVTELQTRPERVPLYKRLALYLLLAASVLLIYNKVVNRQ